MGERETLPLPLLNRWNNNYLQPGVVGSVGDTNLMIRLKHSAPDLPLRWSTNTAFSRLPNYGSNVQDGSIPSYFSSSGSARLLDTKWNGLFYLIPGNRHMNTSTGWLFQDLRSTDLYHEPIVGSQGDYTWHNQVGDVYRARHAGERFLPLPNGYGLQTGQIPRYIFYINCKGVVINQQYLPSSFHNLARNLIL